MFSKRTDLALEAREIKLQNRPDISELKGVKTSVYDKNGFNVTKIDVLDEDGQKELGKPVGSYVTIELSGLMRREEDAFSRASKAVAEELKGMIQKINGNESTALVTGLGNRNITPDAIGPKAVESVMVTRHLIEHMPEEFKRFHRVAAVSPGVLGLTGIETGEIVQGIAEKIKPSFIIAVDALASRQVSRLCTTIQIADTGIVPGGGVGNARFALNKDSLGVPVIAVGVPTVVDAATLAADVAEKSGITIDKPENLVQGGEGLVVTPKDIDRYIADTAKVIGYGINLALHEGIDFPDIDLFLS